MKKFLAMILALVMVLSLVACGKDDTSTEDTDGTEVGDTDVENEEDGALDTETDPETDPEADPDADAPVTQPEKDPEENTDAPSGGDAPSVNTPDTSDVSIGQTLLSQFKGMDVSIGAQAIADQLITNPAIEFMGGTVPVEPGLLTGFGNAEITGFSEGVMFAPMIGSIAFMGYIFEVEEGADVAAFVEMLKTNCNPRWNICTEADETNIHNIGNTVFFLMSRVSYEE